MKGIAPSAPTTLPSLTPFLWRAAKVFAGEVALDFRTAEQDEPDIGVGDDVGDDLLKAEVFGLAGTAQCRPGITDTLFVKVRAHGNDGYGAVCVTGNEVTLDERPATCW